MSYEFVGTVNEEEKEEIKMLYERKLALNDLIKLLSNQPIEEMNKSMYERLINDNGSTLRAFQTWWGSKSKKYKWKSVENGQWQINFETNEIFLVY